MPGLEYQNQEAIDTEYETGADFGLILRIAPDQSRIGLFQAKREKSQQPRKLKLHHMSGALFEGGEEEPQLLRLKNYGHGILDTINSDVRTLEELRWIHYVRYGPGTCRSFSVEQMKSAVERYEARLGPAMRRENSIPLKELDEREFGELLPLGAEAPGGAGAGGWLDTTDAVARKTILELAAHIPIFEGIDRSTGPVQDLVNDTELAERGIARRSKQAPNRAAHPLPKRRGAYRMRNGKLKWVDH